jgi:ClpP class serine protease
VSGGLSPRRTREISVVLGRMFDRLVKYEQEAEDAGDVDEIGTVLNAIREARVAVGMAHSATGHVVVSANANG